MRKFISPYPALAVDGDGSGVVSQAGAVLLLRTAERIGLVKGLSKVLALWRKSLATHDPGKIVLELAASRRIRPCRVWSQSWPSMRRKPCPPSLLRGMIHAATRGRWLSNTHEITVSMPSIRC